MEWLYVLGALLLLFLIGQILIHVTVIYRDQPEVLVRVLFFSFRVIPGKEKKIKLGDFRIKKFRKKRLKERALLRKKARKAAESKAKKKKRKAERKSEKKQRKSLRQVYEELKETADFGLTIAKHVALPLVSRFRRSLRIRVKRLCITVSTDDAAKTAQLYGIVCAAVADLLAILEQATHLRYEKGMTVTVLPDFVSGKTTMDLHLRFSLRLRHILALPFWAVIDYIKLLIQKS